MNLRGKYDGLFLLIAALWIAVWVLAIVDQYIAAFMISIVLMLLHMILGSAHKERIDRKYLLYPLLAWAVIWAVGFYLAYVNDVSASKGLFLGFHASFGPVVYFYWIGGVLTLTLGYFFLKRHWLSDTQWEEFVQASEKYKAQKGGDSK